MLLLRLRATGETEEEEEEESYCAGNQLICQTLRETFAIIIYKLECLVSVNRFIEQYARVNIIRQGSHACPSSIRADRNVLSDRDSVSDGSSEEMLCGWIHV